MVPSLQRFDARWQASSSFSQPVSLFPEQYQQAPKNGCCSELHRDDFPTRVRRRGLLSYIFEQSTSLWKLWVPYQFFGAFALIILLSGRFFNEIAAIFAVIFEDMDSRRG